MDKSNNRLFIHKNMEHISLEHSVEIILTPEFYTFIREELDIKFAYQAKQIAESLFDDYLKSNEEYQYHAKKTDGAWYFYAYNIEEIETFLENIGLEKHRISRIYFAQELKNELHEPILLSNKTILQTIEETVTVIPSQLMDSDVEFKVLNLSQVKLNSGVSMGASYNSLISIKETILLSAIFFTLGTIFILEGNRIKTSISEDQEKVISLINDNPSYDSSMLRENILQKYQPIDKSERNKRQAIKDLSKLLSAKSELTSLSIEKSKIIANIKTSDPSIAKQVTQSAKAKNFKSSISTENVKVEKNL